MKRFLLSCVALLLVAPIASAGVVIGPGDVNTTNGDQAHDLIAVDLKNPAKLAAGTYLDSLFERQFTNFAGFNTTGTITPVLLIGGGTAFTPIAIGGTLTYSGATPFISGAFDGSNTFTLAASTTV
jgi:hypothetical protein